MHNLLGQVQRQQVLVVTMQEVEVVGVMYLLLDLLLDQQVVAQVEAEQADIIIQALQVEVAVEQMVRQELVVAEAAVQDIAQAVVGAVQVL